MIFHWSLIFVLLFPRTSTHPPLLRFSVRPPPPFFYCSGSSSASGGVNGINASVKETPAFWAVLARTLGGDNSKSPDVGNVTVGGGVAVAVAVKREEDGSVGGGGDGGNGGNGIPQSVGPASCSAVQREVEGEGELFRSDGKNGGGGECVR